MPRTNRNLKSQKSRPSIKQEKIMDTEDSRNSGIAPEKIKPLRTNERSFNLLVDDVPYLVKASPYSFNGEARFYININGGDDHVFTWDSELGALRAIDDNAGILPNVLEEAISQKLQSQMK